MYKKHKGVNVVASLRDLNGRSVFGAVVVVFAVAFMISKGCEKQLPECFYSDCHNEVMAEDEVICQFHYDELQEGKRNVAEAKKALRKLDESRKKRELAMAHSSSSYEKKDDGKVDDEFDVSEFSDAEDFYDYYWDDFESIEEAEDYYYDHC